MAKTRATANQTRKTAPGPTAQDPPASPDSPDSPEIRSAADAMRRAKLEWEKARQFYDEVRRETTERIESVRETTLGDVLDGALDAVRRRPALGLSVAALIGFFLGRSFRR